MPVQWSPHSAALNRRRKGKAVDKSSILVSLDDLGDDLPLPGTTTRRKGKKTATPVIPSIAKGKGRLSQEDLPMEVQKKLSILTDPTTPLKEKIELEVEMRNNPDEEVFLAEFRNNFSNKLYLEKKQEMERLEQEQLNKNLKEEAERAAKEQEEFMKIRLAQVEEELQKQEREIQLQKDVQMHMSKVAAKDAKDLRKGAERALVSVTKKKAKAHLAEQERQARLTHFRKRHGGLSHVEMKLKEAMLEQKETKS